MLREVEILDEAGLGSVIQVQKITAVADYAAKERTDITCVADVSASLDGTYFILQDEVGSVAFWIDVDNSGTSAPTHGADRAVEITTVTSDMSAIAVGGAVYTAIVADSKFEAGADNGDGTIEVQSTTYGTKTAGVDGDTGFTITVGVTGDAGLDAKYFLLNDVDGSVAFWIDLDNSGTSAPTHGADRAVEITTIATGDSAATIAGLLETAIHSDSKFTASSATIYCTVTNVDIGNVGAPSDGDTGFTLVATTDGYTQSNVASEAIDIRDARGYCALVEWTSTTCAATIKMQESLDKLTWVDTPSATGAQAVADNNGTVLLNLIDRNAPYCRAKIAYTSGTLTTANVVFFAK